MFCLRESMRKILISVFIFVSCFSFAEVGEWEFGNVVDEMTGQESRTLVVISTSSDNIALGYYCNNALVTVIDGRSYQSPHSQLNRVRTDNNEVSYYNWIQNNLQPGIVHLVDVRYNPDGFFSGDRLILEFVTYYIDDGEEYGEVEHFEFPIIGWKEAVQEHCSGA